jgi:hypothetical protein
MSVSFDVAYEAARRRYSDERWDALSPRDQCKAIYQEMRRLDADAARQRPPGRRTQRATQPLWLVS